MTKGFDGVVTYDEVQAMVSHSPEMELALNKASQLDFTMLTFKLMEEKGWTFEHCQEVQDLYRKFLALNVCYPDRKVCPTGPVDEFWHAHILDTRAYMADCDVMFGQYLHHFPYFGLRGEADRAALEKAFKESVNLFIINFGIDPTAGDMLARSCASQRCP